MLTNLQPVHQPFAAFFSLFFSFDYPPRESTKFNSTRADAAREAVLVQLQLLTKLRELESQDDYTVSDDDDDGRPNLLCSW